MGQAHRLPGKTEHHPMNADDAAGAHRLDRFLANPELSREDFRGTGDFPLVLEMLFDDLDIDIGRDALEYSRGDHQEIHADRDVWRIDHAGFRCAFFKRRQVLFVIGRDGRDDRDGTPFGQRPVGMNALPGRKVDDDVDRFGGEHLVDTGLAERMDLCLAFAVHPKKIIDKQSMLRWTFPNDPAKLDVFRV